MTASWRRDMRLIFGLYVVMITTGLIVYLVVGLLER
jgi:hypothetical protein